MADNKEYMVMPEEDGAIHISEEVIASIAVGAVRELVLEKDGQFALVYIDDGIVSNSLGYNNLADRVETGRIFRAIGLVYMREDGASVVRVRNCDEVVYVPVIRYFWEPTVPDNPRVGDRIGVWVLCALFTAAAVSLLRKRSIM